MEDYTDKQLKEIWLQEAREQESLDQRIEMDELENEFQNHKWNLN
jgi:hypothetical protein